AISKNTTKLHAPQGYSLHLDVGCADHALSRATISAKQWCSFITYLPRPSTPLPLPASKLSRNLDPLRGDQMRWANLRSQSQRPRPMAATMASSTVPTQSAAT